MRIFTRYATPKTLWAKVHFAPNPTVGFAACSFGAAVVSAYSFSFWSESTIRAMKMQ
jgi:hypothetical protein